MSKPQAAALVHAPHAQVPESGEEEESDEEDAAEEPVSPQRQSPGKKSPKPSKSRKQEALLTTVRVSADTQSNSEKKSEANTKTTTQEQGQHAKGGASVPENGGGEDKSNHSVGKKGKDRKSSPKNAQQQEVEFEAPGVPEDKVEEVCSTGSHSLAADQVSVHAVPDRYQGVFSRFGEAMFSYRCSCGMITL